MPLWSEVFFCSSLLETTNVQEIPSYGRGEIRLTTIGRPPEQGAKAPRGRRKTRTSCVTSQLEKGREGKIPGLGFVLSSLSSPLAQEVAKEGLMN